jgi:hypothetical protein
VSLAFEAVTWRKGRVLEQVRGWRRRLSDLADGPLRRTAAQWEAMLECRTSLSVALGYRDLKPSVVGGCGLEGTSFAGKYERLLSDLRSRRKDDVAARAVSAVAGLTREGDALEAALNRAVGAFSPNARPASIGSHPHSAAARRVPDRIRLVRRGALSRPSIGAIWRIRRAAQRRQKGSTA